MHMDTNRVSGYADALTAIEDELRRNLLNPGSTEAQSGLEVALAIVVDARCNVHRYYDYLHVLQDEAESAEWEALAGQETDCVPCLAETAPHTCL
jgi:hypothetical protein